MKNPSKNKSLDRTATDSLREKNQFSAFWLCENNAFADCLEAIGFSSSTRAQLLRAFDILESDLYLREAVSQVHDRLFPLSENQPYEISDIRRKIADRDREACALIEALALLAEYPRTLESNRARSISDDVTHETLRDMERWMLDFEKKHGHPGFEKPLWLRNHFQGNLFSLGRLQFELGHAPLPYRVYQHCDGGRLAALANDGLGCDANGIPQIDGGKWQTRFWEDESAFSGHPVNIFDGSIRPYSVQFSKSEWTLCMSQEDSVLHVHIPEGDPLDAKACDCSIERAWEFFDCHFPEISLRGMLCRSWLLEPQLQSLKILNPHSNIVRFGARFHPLPIPGATDYQFRERIFPSDAPLPLPRDTALRRAIAPYLEKGGVLRMVGGVLLREAKKITGGREPSCKAVIPMPLQIVVDDLGWWCGRDGSAENEPFRTGILRNHCVEDYAAAVRLGKSLGMRPMFAMMLGEWDTHGRVEKLFHLPWLAPHFASLHARRLPYEEVASLMRESTDSIEIGLHGILHEYWPDDGKLSRAEWHDSDGRPRPLASWQERLDLYWSLLEEYDFGQAPTSYVPTAYRHHFCREGQNLAEILAGYGISTIYAEIEKMVRTREPSHRWFGFDHSCITVQRSNDPFRWDAIAPEPSYIPPEPVCGMHWPNLLHPDPERNFEVVDRWVSVLQEENLRLDRILSRNTDEFVEQLAHHETTKIDSRGGKLSIDAAAYFRLPWMSRKDKTTLRVRMESDCRFSSNAADPRIHSKIIREERGHVLKEFQIELTREFPLAEFLLRRDSVEECGNG